MENTFYDLTNAQKSIWNTELFFNGSNINNICGTICLDEPLDFKDLQKALKLIIAENDNFRTQFTIKDGSIYQSFLDKVDYDVEIVDINTKEDLKKLENTIISRIFDILNSNLFDIKIFRYPDLTGGVIVNIHHLISDSWTLGLVAKDIVTKYTIVHNKLSNTPNTNSYINYINSIKDRVQKIILKGYNITRKDEYNQYVCIDQYGNYYIFKNTDLMNYTLMLDTYTLDLQEFKEKYDKGTDKEKIKLNINKTVEAVNNKDYKYVYNKLNVSFKNNNFNNEATFENYIKNNFYEINEITNFNYRQEGNVFICTIGLGNKEKEIEGAKSVTILVRLLENRDFEISFSQQ